MKISEGLSLPFYLTGGTALSRFYFHHRYSDDLDLFVNADPDYKKHVELFVRQVLSEKDLSVSLGDPAFIRNGYYSLTVCGPAIETPLKIDLVNDIGFRLGSPVKIACGYLVDSLDNILTNKLSAIVGRSEIKDVVDLVEICNNSSFSWDRMLEDAGRKEAMISASLLVDFLGSVPISELDKVEWIRKPDPDEFRKNLTVICDDMLRKGPNSLALGNRKIRTCLDCSPANGRNPEPAKPHGGSFSLKS